MISYCVHYCVANQNANLIRGGTSETVSVLHV